MASNQMSYAPFEMSCRCRTDVRRGKTLSNRVLDKRGAIATGVRHFYLRHLSDREVSSPFCFWMGLRPNSLVLDLGHRTHRKGARDRQTRFDAIKIRSAACCTT